MMDILLYNVGRNLNRAYRTAEAFGISRLLILGCDTAKLDGSLFGATDRVTIETVTEWPTMAGTLALETSYTMPLWAVNWATVRTLIIGGETSGLPTSRIAPAQTARIPMQGSVSGLTVEAALAIALYERNRWMAHGY